MPSTDSPDEVRASGLILRRRSSAGDRWLLLRARKHREWGFPKGHAESGETALETARRECAEESGIALVAIEGPAHELVYQLPDGRRKRVSYFPARCAGSAVRLSREHTDARWFSAPETERRLPHSGLQALFRAYLAHLRRR